MTNIIATDTASTILLADNDRLYVPRDVEVVVASNYGVRFANTGDNAHEVYVDGTVVSLAVNAIWLTNDADGLGQNRLVIGESGIVRTVNIPGNSAIYMSGTDSVLQNWGEVSGTWGAFLQGWDRGLVENHGVMAGNVQAGVFITSSSNVEVINTGSITGADGVAFSTAAGIVRNSGEIITNGAGNQAIDALAANGAITVLNSGWIAAQTVAIRTGSGFDTVRNSGLIEGDVSLGGGDDLYDGIGGRLASAVSGGSGNDTYLVDDSTIELVELAGEGLDTVRSLVSFHLGAHFENLDLLGAGNVDGRGNTEHNAITGNIGNNLLRGAAGDDTLAGGEGNDLLHGNRGNDLLAGGTGDDTLIGGAGSDTVSYQGEDGDFVIDLAAGTATDGDETDVLRGIEHASGGAGNDSITGDAAGNTLSGGEGPDTLDGGAGADTVSGGGSDDVLRGGADNDLLFGGGGVDVINGGAGADTLVGGAGVDHLFGAAGADVFRYDDAADSGFGSALRDRINDFQQGLDLIDLQAIDAVPGGGDNPFTFIGAANFSATAGELRAVIQGGVTRVLGDLNGDGAPDLEILLTSAFTLTAGDFIL